MKDFSKYDAVLICNETNECISEAYDKRVNTNDGYGKTTGPTTYVDWDDPTLYASNAFGKRMQSELSSLGQGYSAEVSDFGKWVVVNIKHHNVITGRTSSKVFLVVFTGGKKGNDPAGGLVVSNANKWRTISGFSQAISYIRSAASALEYSTSQKI